MGDLTSEIKKNLEPFASNMESELKAYVRKNHYGTGKLFDSIKVSITSSGDRISFSISSYEYIKYLDDGFFESFLKKKTMELKKEIAKQTKKILLKEIKKDIGK